MLQPKVFCKCSSSTITVIVKPTVKSNCNNDLHLNWVESDFGLYFAKIAERNQAKKCGLYIGALVNKGRTI